MRHTPSIKSDRSGWLLAVAGALLINLVLLSILPVVNLGSLPVPDDPLTVREVNFVRVVPPDHRPPEPPTRPPEPVRPPETPLSRPLDPALRPLNPAQDPRPDLAQAILDLPAPALSGIPLAAVPAGVAGLDGVLDADQLDHPLVAVSRMPPLYPLQARRTNVEGWVEVSFLVDENGLVSDIRILQADPPGMFEESTRRAVANWRFQPGTVMGQPVRTRVTTTVRFELEQTP